jgi:hypothetical protein
LRLESNDAHSQLGHQVQQGDWAVPMVFCAFRFRVLRLRAVFYQPLSQSFTNFAYSSSGTFRRFAIAICDGESLTDLRPCFAVLRVAEAAAGATCAPPDFFAVWNLCGNSERMRLSTSV